jgi:hypothetical protein
VKISNRALKLQSPPACDTKVRGRMLSALLKYDTARSSTSPVPACMSPRRTRTYSANSKSPAALRYEICPRGSIRAVISPFRTHALSPRSSIRISASSSGRCPSKAHDLASNSASGVARTRSAFSPHGSMRRRSSAKVRHKAPPSILNMAEQDLSQRRDECNDKFGRVPKKQFVIR